MNLSKDLSDQFNEKMQQTHDPKELDGWSSHSCEDPSLTGRLLTHA